MQMVAKYIEDTFACNEFCVVSASCYLGNDWSWTDSSYKHAGEWWYLFSAALVRKEIQDETDRLTGKTKQISPVPIHLSIYSPHGTHTLCLTYAASFFFLMKDHSCFYLSNFIFPVSSYINKTVFSVWQQYLCNL
jgi:hypothetical protein